MIHVRSRRKHFATCTAADAISLNSSRVTLSSTNGNRKSSDIKFQFLSHVPYITAQRERKIIVQSLEAIYPKKASQRLTTIFAVEVQWLALFISTSSLLPRGFTHHTTLIKLGRERSNVITWRRQRARGEKETKKHDPVDKVRGVAKKIFDWDANNFQKDD
jgi:hypothetical protein